MNIARFIMVNGVVLLTLSVLTACAARTTLHLRYLGTTGVGSATAPTSSLTCVRARATRIKGRYDLHPMSLAIICEADFEVTPGAIPRNASITQVHIEFFQGDTIAQLLQKSKDLTLVFDEKGELVRVER